MLAAGLATLPQITIDLATVQSDIVIFRLHDERWTPASFVRALAERGLLVGEIGRGYIRAVTHYGIDASDIEEALDLVRSTLAHA
jgi:threonine aldolase